MQNPGRFDFELVSIFDRHYVRICFGEDDWEQFDSDEPPYASAVASNLLRRAWYGTKRYHRSARAGGPMGRA